MLLYVETGMPGMRIETFTHSDSQIDSNGCTQDRRSCYQTQACVTCGTHSTGIFLPSDTCGFTRWQLTPSSVDLNKYLP